MPRRVVLLGLHLPLCGLSSLLGSFAVYCGGALGRQGRALRVGLRPSRDTRPPAVAALRKEGAKTTLQRASRSDGRAIP